MSQSLNLTVVVSPETATDPDISKSELIARQSANRTGASILVNSEI